MKKLVGVYHNPRGHWVGDGFPVRTLFAYDGFGQQLSPFLMLDHAGPQAFSPTDRPRGVGQHPHRGFETVTIVYEGEVAHRDSSGGGGIIGKGDVQWMTAGAGIIHEEFHSPAFSEKGGLLEMVQLWVNLPAKDKMTPPRYQSITSADIPVVQLADDAGLVRVIAGDFNGQRGAAMTFSPVDVWDVRLQAGKSTTLSVPEGRAVAVIVLHGEVQVNDGQAVPEAHMAVLASAESAFVLSAASAATILVLSGAALHEPIEGYGPFVMNTKQEIRQAIHDFNSGRFGQIVS